MKKAMCVLMLALLGITVLFSSGCGPRSNGHKPTNPDVVSGPREIGGETINPNTISGKCVVCGKTAQNMKVVWQTPDPNPYDGKDVENPEKFGTCSSGCLSTFTRDGAEGFTRDPNTKQLVRTSN